MSALLDAALDDLGLADRYEADELSTAERQDIVHQLRLNGREDLRRLFEVEFGLGGEEDEAADFSVATFGLGKLVKGWKDKASKYIKELFVAGALALFGPEPLEAKDVAFLEAQHAVQAAFLDDFAKELDKGKVVPDPTTAARAGSYGSSVWGAVQGLDLAHATAAGYTEGRRVHNGRDLPCSGCLSEIRKGWISVDELKPIGEMQCRESCHCVHEFRKKGPATMSKLTKAERDKLGKESFADPERRLFPILDQDDVDSAGRLLGKAKNPAAVKARIIALAKRLKLTIPEAWQAKPKAAMSEGEPGSRALFSASLDMTGRRVEDGYAIYPNALLFRAGTYEDKRISVTPEDLWLTVETFTTPLGGNIEHTSFLAGKACELRSTHLDEADSSILRGSVAVPLWLDENLGDRERKLSAEWDRETVTLDGLALCVSPRIADAALMAAFAEACPSEAPAVFAAAQRTYHGSSAIQSVRDQCARSGALCDASNSSSTRFTAGRERAGLQQMHDLSVKHGAKCSMMSGRSAALYSADKPSGKGKFMSLKTALKALFAGNPDTAPPDEAIDAVVDQLPKVEAEEKPKEGAAATTTATVTTSAATFADSPEAKAMQKQIEELKRANATTRIAADAAKFADGEIKAERSLPSELLDLIADFTEAAVDDLDQPRKVTFSTAEGKPVSGSRVDRLKARCARRPRTILTKERFIDGELPEGARVLFNGEDPKAEKKPTEKRTNELLAMSHEGSAALKLRANGTK